MASEMNGARVSSSLVGHYKCLSNAADAGGSGRPIRSTAKNSRAAIPEQPEKLPKLHDFDVLYTWLDLFFIKSVKARLAFALLVRSQALSETIYCQLITVTV